VPHQILDESVADFAVRLLLSISRRLHVSYDTCEREWRGEWGHDVHGKTLGILGCGRIGLAVARRATGFNMRVIAYDPVPNPAAIKLGVTFVSFDELLAQSDYLSLHSALTPESRGIIGEGQFRKMKKTAYLVNTGRGQLVKPPWFVR
jgi:lactate dehydrogenase-like 2-hydroxyacid dehydrogenase